MPSISRSSEGQSSNWLTTTWQLSGWTMTNPRGDDEHYGVVHYGTNPEDLSQTSKGHTRLNRAHPETIFRVRIGRPCSHHRGSARLHAFLPGLTAAGSA